MDDNTRMREAVRTAQESKQTRPMQLEAIVSVISTRHPGPWRRLLGVLAVLALTVGIVPAGVSAQEDEVEAGLTSDTEFQLLSGGTVTWDEPWEVDSRESGFDEEIPGYVVSLFTNLDGRGQSRTYDAQFYLFTSLALVEPAVVRDSILERNETAREEGFEIVDQGEDGNSAYSLTRFVGPDDEPWGSFHFVTYSPSESELYSTEMITNIEDYEDTVTSVQEVITIEDEPAFNGVDAAELSANLAEGVEPTTETESATETETETETDTESATETETETATETESATETETESATETETETETETGTDTEESGNGADLDPEQEELGLVSETEYESPQHGYALEWDESWALDDEEEEPLVSDEDSESDRLSLINEEDTAFLTISGFPAQGDTPEDAVEYFATTYVEDNLSDQAEVLLEEADNELGAVVISDETESGLVLIQYFEFVVLEESDTIVQITLTVPADSFEDAFGAVEDEITLDGEQVLTSFDAEEVLDAA